MPVPTHVPSTWPWAFTFAITFSISSAKRSTTSPFAAHGYGPVLLAGAEMLRLLKTHRLEINDSSVQLYR